MPKRTRSQSYEDLTSSDDTAPASEPSPMQEEEEEVLAPPSPSGSLDVPYVHHFRIPGAAIFGTIVHQIPSRETTKDVPPEDMAGANDLYGYWVELC